MAVTSIWHVSNRMDMALDYIMNPEKTTEKPELSPEAVAARQAVGDVINYASTRTMCNTKAANIYWFKSTNSTSGWRQRTRLWQPTAC